jgi:pSer/pThr/pTyr-binding forkhead associated (FHA) protein
MPAFVIFALGQSTKGAAFDGEVVRVGRDPTNDIVLGGEAVSREHAVFSRGVDGRWTVRCLSQTNPIIVQGAVVTTSANVVEGTEVLVGTDALVVFSENTETARKYLGGPMVMKMRCTKCGWAGLVSKVNKKPVCPGCGSVRLSPFDAAEEQGEVKIDTTKEVKDEVAQQLYKKMRYAKHSFIERMGDTTSRRRLTEKEVVEIGTSAPTALRLDGLTFGSAQIRWEDEHYVIESSMKFPAMKVNGAKTTSARLAPGDLIEIGSNRFRFLSE